MPVNNLRTRLNIDDNQSAKTVQNMVPAELFFAGNIVDGDGNKTNRLLIRLKGDKQFYFLFAKGYEENMKKPAEWLQTELERLIDGSSGDAAPSDIDHAVPTGSPLG